MSSLFLELLHGAVTRVGPTDTAFAHRSTGYNFAILSQWADPEESDANIAWTRETYKRMEPYMTSGAYVNYLGDDAPQASVQGAYGPNFERLRAVKDRYDPGNLFHQERSRRRYGISETEVRCDGALRGRCRRRDTVAILGF